ncbi:DUF397 domain-containing protein [Actinomadura sp. WMMB 499]|uniref:DUF397 domain-containing protein n=1 Tax=Actinomadura sp. WMMB 499 TaxID=1219491 RepID=UPI00124625C1|nr:DUF397 domain-containing protein [Actinomadura sp. WMMB 499]QFG22652.1 DUF397 domain-containing protein [Actinomadura sp. WMMB 499]
MSANTPAWRKASRSTNNGGACVELASFSEAVALRDSKDPEGPKIIVNRRDFASLLNRIKTQP